MTSGESFEGLNHAGHLGKDIVVVLNDNEMSISPNVGALSSYMSRLMTGHISTRIRDEMEKIIGGLPKVGEQALKFAKRFEESVKSMVIPGVLFEELGFKYVGPIPGHRIQHLVETFRNVRQLNKPILDDISVNVFLAGDVGAGHTMKLVNNLLSGTQRVLTLECLALAAKNGIEPTDAVRILMAGGARNVFLEKGMGPIIEQGDLGPPFSLELMHKDIDLACRVGNDSEMPMFFGSVTRDVYRLAMNLVGKDQPVNTVARVMEQISDAKIVGGE